MAEREHGAKAPVEDLDPAARPGEPERPAMDAPHDRQVTIERGVVNRPISVQGDAEFERQVAMGRGVMRKHRNVLAALAK